MSNITGKISKDDVYQKVDDILFFIYETLLEQLFQMPLPISNTPEKRRSFRQERPNLVDFDEDQSQQAGKVFWDAIDTNLKSQLEAQIAYVASKKTPFGLNEAKAEVTLFCSTKSRERVAATDQRQVEPQDVIAHMHMKNSDTALLASTGFDDPDRAGDHLKINPSLDTESENDAERNYFVNDYIESNVES